MLSLHEGDFMTLERVQMARRLASILGCRCLVADEGPDPYQMVLVDPNHDPQIVNLCVDRLDEEQFVIAEG